MARRRPEPPPRAGWLERLICGRGLPRLAALFALAALALYARALPGPFVSDDLHYVATNPYVHDPSAANIVAILDPSSPATVMIVNYAPVQMLTHALEWQVFGENTTATTS